MGDTDWKWLERHKKQQGGTSMSLPVLITRECIMTFLIPKGSL